MSETEPLYTIATRYRAALEDLSGRDDLPEEVVRDTLDALEGDVRDKAIAVAKYMLGVDRMADAIKAEEDRLKARRKRIEARNDALSAYLKHHMERCEIERIECPWFVLAIRKNPPAVVVDDSFLIPDEYKEMVVESKISKAAIKEALSKGIPVEGAHLEQTTRLDIR